MNSFDTIPHEPLMRLVERRISDPKLLRVIRGWLKAGMLENGVVNCPEAGTPQGGVLSPLLANIYLHELDREWQGRGPRAQIVRYADDLLILCPTEADARGEQTHLQAVTPRMGLTLNAEKTRLVEAREGFDFLGFSYRRGDYKRNGKRRETMVKVPRARAVKAMQQKLKEAVQAIPLGEPVMVAVKVINPKLRGWVNYFRVSNAEAAVKGLVWHAGRQLRVFLRRKYQRKRCQHGRRWPDKFFHEQLGLLTTDALLLRKGAEC